MAFKFTHIDTTAPLRSPHVLVGKTTITLPSLQIIESLGNPKFVSVEVDETNKALRILKVSSENLQSKPIKYRKDMSGSPWISVYGIDKLLPKGFYKPVGGGMFIFERAKAPHKSHIKGE